MRFVVFGAGAIGGVAGGRLFEHGHEVVLIARGAHGEALRDRGLQLESPDAVVTLPIETVSSPAGVAWKDGDVVLLGMKSQDTGPALAELAAVAPPHTPVVCMQNGVANERAALRNFDAVYGMCVMCPTTHLVPGVVQAHSTPTTGIMDVGRYPSGSDATAHAVAAAFQASTFLSDARPDVMRLKYQKLLMNLGNVIEAACGPSARRGELAARTRAEGAAVLQRAGIEPASDEEDAARRGDHLRMQPIGGERRGGGSTWQSVARGASSLETDYLNGEIVLIAREHGFDAPVNSLLQRVARELVASGASPGSMSEEELLARLDSA